MSVVLVTEEAIPPVYRFSLTEKLAGEIGRLGKHVHLVSVKGRGQWKGAEGVEHHPVEVAGWSLFDLRKRVEANLKLSRKVLSLCARGDVGIVYGWWPVVFFARLAGRRIAADMPEFIDVMYRSFGKPASWIMGPCLRAFQRSVAGLCEFVVTESDIARAVWQARGVPYEKTHALPYGVEVDVFGAAKPGSFRKDCGIGEDETVILYHGDIGIDDGVDVLLEAARGLPARVVIAGDGDSAFMGALKKLAPSDVIFTGWIPYEMMPAVVASADICCAPFRSSLYTNSTFPLKPMEAMAAGKALVMSELHAFCRVVRDGFDCRLVTPGDSGQLREALIELIEDKDKRLKLGQEARRTAMERFHWRARVEREAKMLMEACSLC